MLDKTLKIGFIGGGNMARALISGLVNSGHPSDNIMVCAPSAQTRANLAHQFDVVTQPDNQLALDFADVVVLAVKPHMISTICQELTDSEISASDTLFISVAAGIDHEFLKTQLNDSDRIVCAMPNLPSAIGQGLTGLYRAPSCDVFDIMTADELMKSVGKTLWVDDEALMPAVVAAAGSSPAYFFLFMESMEKAAIAQGLSPTDARRAVLQSALGAVTLAAQSAHNVGELREQVTSAKGTTASALNSFQQGGIDELVKDAMDSAALRANELYQQNQS